MRAWLVAIALCACTTKQTPVVVEPPPPPDKPLVALGDWEPSATEAFRGKQDDIFIVSPKVGFYGNGSGKVFRTDDGGATWTKVLEQKGTYVRALGFLDDKRGFLGNIGPDSFPNVTDPTMLYRTDDGGTTWKPVTLPNTEAARGVCAIDILKVDAVNAGHRLRKEIVHVGGRVGGPASLFATDDGGTTWSRIALPKQIAMILDVKFLDVSTGFLFAGTDPDTATSHGLILKTTDSGRTWKTVYESKRPFELMWKGAFPSRMVGYATLQNYSSETAATDPQTTAMPSRFVVKTDDGGDTWRELPMVEDAKVQEFGVGFIDDRHGWVGGIPYGFETADGGATWTPAKSMPTATNKIRVIKDGDHASMWAIGTDVRHLEFGPPPGTGASAAVAAP